MSHTKRLVTSVEHQRGQSQHDPARENPGEFTFLVAFQAHGVDRAAAERALREVLPPPGEVVQRWWVAEPDRGDGSDNDSAIFVPYVGAYVGACDVGARDVGQGA